MDSNSIKQNRDFISNLRYELVRQLKNSPWEPSYSQSFKNDYFSFQVDNSTWYVSIKYDRYNTSDKIKVTEFIPMWKFKLLKFLFVERRLRDYKKIKREAELAKFQPNSLIQISL